MYKVMCAGVEVHCETEAELASAVRLAKTLAADDGSSARPPTPGTPTAGRTPQTSLAGIEEGVSRWVEPAKAVIALLAKAGKEGLHVDDIATVAGLNGTRGSSPLRKAIIELLGGDETVIRRRRTPEGKVWAISTKGHHAGVKAGLIPQTEAPNGR